MMRSLYSGVAGLNNHQVKMDVLSNNISNVNTHGFKKSRVTFQDMISQTLSPASRPEVNRGGVNPRQVGLGMNIATIDTIHTQGALQTTGVKTDMSIVGEGFFINQKGDETFYTRKGAFSIDSDGFLVNPSNGFRVQGYQGVEQEDGSILIDSSGLVEDIVIPIGLKVEPRTTTYVRYKCNLSKETPIIPENANSQQIKQGSWKSSIEVIGSSGDKQLLQLDFRKRLDITGNEIPNEWVVNTRVFRMDGANLGTEVGEVIAQTIEEDTTNDFVLRFAPNGTIESIIDPITETIIGTAGEGLTVNIGYQLEGVPPMNIELDLGQSGSVDGITQFSSPSSTKAWSQNGIEMGYLKGFKIDDSGIVVGNYSNGTTQEIARLALAKFTNPEGLEKVGSVNFVESNNSGQAIIDAANGPLVGAIRSGTLEMSNVDLATEFTEMITTQRGFQANSRAITTSDTMLEEVLRLKR